MKPLINPKVSIIILNYNGWQDTIECLESVLRNDYDNYQVIVVDNNSQNNSLDYIKAWADGKLNVWTKPDNSLRHLSFPPVEKPIPYIFYTREEAENGGIKELESRFTENDYKGTTTKYPLVLIQSGDNLGFAGGNNVAIRYVLAKDDSDYIWLLNNDTVIDRIALKELVKLAESDNGIGIIGSKILWYDNPKMIQSCGGMKILKLLTKAENVYIYQKDSELIDQKNIYFDFILGSSLIVSKNTIKTIGLMDESYFMYWEDAEFGLRAKKNNIKLEYASNSRLWHKGGASCKGFVKKMFLFKKKVRSELKRFSMDLYGYRNLIYLYKNYFPYLLPLFFLRFIYKSIQIILYDDHKIIRLNMLVKAFYYGFTGKMGRVDKW
ncbi:MAG: glycosyltransferase family 2 protein [Elusimicrobia bacterium]|nr:glycosyltransferase family 2 protein [Elusimicrobiota bacterium]